MESRSGREHVVGWKLFGQTEGRELSQMATAARLSHRESLRELVLETMASQGLRPVDFNDRYTTPLPAKVLDYIRRFHVDDVHEVIGISDELNGAHRASQAAGILAVASEGLRRFAVRMAPELTPQDIDDFVPNIPQTYAPAIVAVADVP